MLSGEKILMTGVTSSVGRPVVRRLAAQNEVWGIGRFGDPAARTELEEMGVHCVAVDLSKPDWALVPDDCSYVINFAVSKTGEWDADIAANCESVALLMHQCRNAKAFLHCSSTAVYQPNGHRAFVESDALGDSHRPLMPTYSITKIAAEAVARASAKVWGLPTTIARLNVPYGDYGGWPGYHLQSIIGGHPIPVHTDAPTLYNPIHSDDIVENLEVLLGAASVPATVVNWAGEDTVGIEEWSQYLGELVDCRPSFVSTEMTLPSVAVDVTRYRELGGRTTVPWKTGFRRMVAALHPEIVSTEAGGVT